MSKPTFDATADAGINQRVSDILCVVENLSPMLSTKMHQEIILARSILLHNGARKVRGGPIMRLIAAALAAALGTPVSAQYRAATHELDTIGYPVEKTNDDVSASAIGRAGVTTDTTVPLELRVTLESVSPAGAAYTDRLIYEILVENRGQRSVLLPWSPGSRPRNSSAGSLTSGSIALIVRDSKGQTLTDFALQPLAGSSERPASLQLLAPGETARIRAAGEWRTSERGLNAVLHQPAGRVWLSALFTIDSVASVLSSNSVEVVLEGPRKR